MSPPSNLKPLILHAHSTGPNPFKVSLALEFLSLPYTVKLWAFGSDASSGVKGTAFTKINENGRVPALEDPNTGVTSWESGACVNYLLRVYDKQGKLSPRAESGDEQKIVDGEKWIFFLVSTLGPMMGQVNWFRHYHSQPNEDALRRFEAQAYRCYDVFEAHPKRTGSKWILPGKGPSAVDCHFYPWVHQHEFAELSLREYPTVEKWLGDFGGVRGDEEGV